MDKNTDAISPAPGDRFPVPAAVPSESPSLAIAPYSFTFRAAAKGRWLGLPLLTLFAKEFAYVPSVSFEETRMDGTMPDESDNSHSKTDNNNNNNNNKTTNYNSSCSGCSSSEEDSQATRDVRVTLMAYVKELQCGALWLHGREAECRAAGRAYEDEIREILCDKSNPCAVPWAVLCSDLRAKPETEAKDILGQLTARLVLRQKDVILHRVLRREAMMPGGDVIHILRYDEDVPQNLPPSHSPQRRLLVCCKPHGLPVHPSGRCRKNSVTSILSDVFGGADAFRYHAVPLDEPPLPNGVRRVAIRHKTYGFELIRVWIGPGYVSDAAWRQLRELLSVSFSFSSPSRGVKPFVVHRLDAATSGVLIFGLDAHSSRVTSALLAQKTMDSAEETDSSSGAAIGCTKQYLARVCGRFDVEELSRTQHHCSRVQSRGHFWLRVDRPIGCLSHHDSLYGTPGAEDAENWMRSKKNEIEEEKEKNEKEAALPGRKRGHLAMADIEAKRERMRQKTFGQRRARDQDADGMEHGNGDPESGDTVTNDDALRQLHETLKRAVTLVRCVSYDSSNNESVLECHLLTGRTHQVRVHLASLGHPICGDVKYYSPIGKDDDKSSGIQLHAWRYTLQYSSSEQPEILVAPPPAWAEI